METLILEAMPISVSGNIALYPALAMNQFGHMACAWYEYSSHQETDRSDIWISFRDQKGLWAKPVCISGGVSYNNGPSLTSIRDNDSWWCAWHSWRPPGREPFIADGDVTNIWLSNVTSGGVMQEAIQAIPSASNTEYASLTTSSRGDFQLLYYDRSIQSQCLTPASRSMPFMKGSALPGGLGTGQHGDSIIGSDEVIWIAYVGVGGGIYIASKGSDGLWSPPRRIDPEGTRMLTRPKLSLCSDGTLWVACHSTTWGSRTSRYRVRIERPELTIQFWPGNTPGDKFWTCNTISLRGVGHERFFSFGPDVFGPSPNITVVTAENSLYEPERGYGFETPPKTQLRKLGSPLVRGLFFDSSPSKFRLRVPAGEYEIEIVHCPWIAPRSGMKVSFDSETLASSLPHQERDAVILLQVCPDGKVREILVTSGGDHDENRPSKVIHDPGSGHNHLAWTRYGPNRIEIVHASFAAH